MIKNADCREFLKQEDLVYDYIFTSPPDFLEIGLVAKKDIEEYKSFLHEVFSLFNPKKNVVSLLMTDKKKDSKVYTKHKMNIEVMESLGWELINQKVWVRSLSSNNYEMTYSFVLSFKRVKKIQQNKPKDYLPDVYVMKRDAPTSPEFKHNRINKNAYPVSLGTKFISNFTNEGEIVCYPYMGIGTTAIAALETGRRVIGCELDEEVFRLCLKRLDIHQEEDITQIFGS